MSLQNQGELEATRAKLRVLEERYLATAQQADSGDASHVAQLSAQSLKRIINQLKEEIARFETRAVRSR